TTHVTGAGAPGPPDRSHPPRLTRCRVPRSPGDTSTTRQCGEALGRVTFPTSCRPEAKRHFERGVALLHSFWYERESDAFRTAVAACTGLGRPRRDPAARRRGLARPRLG